MTRVAFWMDCPAEYAGGINYVRNLLFAVSLLKDGRVSPYVFFGNHIDESIVESFRPYAKIVRTSALDSKSFLWYSHKVLIRYFNSFWVINTLMRRHGISVISHVWDVFADRSRYKVIGWIPDFQYLHLPEFFPQLDSHAESSRMLKLIESCDMVILSSHAALKDYENVAPKKLWGRARVLPFVSQPVKYSGTDNGDIPEINLLLEKYGIPDKYYLLPNQFWAHKNHSVAFKAVKILKDSGVNIQLVCTGNPYDYRLKNTSCYDSLMSYVVENGLQDNIKMLGMIEYGEVLALMRGCLAVINPSRFEGWSSSVEEAKSVGKPVILSNLEVHVEQAPNDGHYFAPDDVAALADIMAKMWDRKTQIENKLEDQSIALNLLSERTMEYAKRYVSLLREVVKE